MTDLAKLREIVGDIPAEAGRSWWVDKAFALAQRLAAVEKVEGELRGHADDPALRHCSGVVAYQCAADLLAAALKTGEGNG